MTTATATRPAPAQGRPEIAKNRKKIQPFRVIAFVILAGLALTWLTPVLWAVLTSFKQEADAASAPITFWPRDGFTLQAYSNVLAEGLVPRWAINSFVTSAAITFITVLISALAGYALSRFDFRGKGLILGLIVGSIMIPGQILIVPLFQQMLTLNLVDT